VLLVAIGLLSPQAVRARAIEIDKSDFDFEIIGSPVWIDVETNETTFKLLI
jgi:hypothetical protein